MTADGTVATGWRIDVDGGNSSILIGAARHLVDGSGTIVLTNDVAEPTGNLPRCGARDAQPPPEAKKCSKEPRKFQVYRAFTTE